MDRMCVAGSRLFGSLAVVLAVLAALVVPTQSAFADSGFDCSTFCSQYSGSQYTTCMSDCQSCDSLCAPFGVGTQGYYDCMGQCLVGFGVCDDAHCPTPRGGNTCSVNNNNMSGCLDLGCTQGNMCCSCVWNSSNNTCNCPP